MPFTKVLVLRWLPVLLVAGGCKGTNRGSEPATEFRASSSVVANGPAPTPRMARADAASQPPTPAPVQKLVRSGDIRIELHDVDAGMRRADSIATASGGIVADSRVSQSDQGLKEAQLTLRVPASRFESVMAALRGLGQVRNEGTTTEDITRAYTDLEIRLAVKEATVTRLRGLLANQTGKLADVLAVERELDRAVSELEQMKGEQRFDDQRAAMSTITASLYQPTVPSATNVTGPIGDALRRSLEVFASSLSALIYLVVFLVPWVVVLSVLWWGIRKLRTKRS